MREHDRSALATQVLGAEIDDAGLLTGLALGDLFDLALRVNPKRPHLLVSTVLGKHVPTDPRVVLGAGLLLGARVAEALGTGGGSRRPGPAAASGGRGGQHLRW